MAVNDAESMLDRKWLAGSFRHVLVIICPVLRLQVKSSLAIHVEASPLLRVAMWPGVVGARVRFPPPICPKYRPLDKLG